MRITPLLALLVGFSLPFVGLAADSSTAVSTDLPFVVSGGLSPDHKLAVVVYGDVNWNSAEAENATKLESDAYLYNYETKKIIGPLEEVEVDGGTWGTTQSNVAASWSPGGQFLCVTFRGGRLIHGFVVYKVSHGELSAVKRASVRATPQKLPKKDEGPNAKVVYLNSTTGPNSGESVEGWLSPVEFSAVEYGLRAKDLDSPLSSTINEEGQIRIVYKYANRKWNIDRFEKLPDNY
jgi:hypothetical protein